MTPTVIDGSPEITFYPSNKTADEPDTGNVFDRVRLLANGYCHALITQGYRQKFFPPREIVEVIAHKTDTAPIPDDEYRIDHGAEIWFTGDRDPMPSDEVALLPGAWLAARTHDGGVIYLPEHAIDSVHTHTSDEQESAGWFRD
jgi:hypothetical protein